MCIMKNAKITIVFYSVFVIFFFAAIYAFPILLLYAESESEQSEKTSTLPDYELKAGFIRTFANFCEWPPNSTVANPDVPFIIGALEENDVTAVLTEKTKNRRIGGKQTKILIIADDNEIKNCNLLYISGISEKRLQKILEIVGNLPILTVSDIPDFEEKGVMINMFNVGKNIRFNVNLVATRKNGLQLNSKILRFAIVIIQ